MTDRQAEVFEAYTRIGTIRGTARELGIDRKTVSDLLSKAGAKETKAQVDAKAKNAEHLKRIRELENLVKQQDKHINNLRSTKIPPKQKAAKRSKTKSFCRVILADTHGSHIDNTAWHAVRDDIKKLNPAEVILLGDHVDAGGFLAQHFTLGYVAECEYTFEQDIAAANLFLDELQDAAPNAKIEYLEGNHERRIEKFCVTSALRNPRDAAFLKKLFSVSSLLSLKSRGINYYEQGKFYDGLSVPATIKRGHCYFTHGSSTSKNAAKVNVEQYAGNIVFGHIHRIQSYSTHPVGSGVISGWCPGCLCQTHPLWNHDRPTNWASGYALQQVRNDGKFLHVNIPIIDGESLFEDILN